MTKLGKYQRNETDSEREREREDLTEDEILYPMNELALSQSTWRKKNMKHVFRCEELKIETRNCDGERKRERESKYTGEPLIFRSVDVIALRERVEVRVCFWFHVTHLALGHMWPKHKSLGETREKREREMKEEKKDKKGLSNSSQEVAHISRRPISLILMAFVFD